MGHGFKPVTTEQGIQVAILDELQQIRQLLEPSTDPAPLPDDKPEPARAAEPEAKPAAKKAASKKTATRRTATGR